MTNFNLKGSVWDFIDAIVFKKNLLQSGCDPTTGRNYWLLYEKSSEIWIEWYSGEYPKCLQWIFFTAYKYYQQKYIYENFGIKRS